MELQNERSATVEMKLKGANANPRITSSEPMEAKMNYFIGDDPKQWKTDVPTFAKVKYEQVYPGTDVVYYGNQQQLEYDFIVAPQADPSAIKLQFNGVNAMRLDEAGNLLLATEAGEVKQHKPIIYQEVAGERRTVQGGYRIAQNEASFEIGDYDRSLPLVIDPVIAYATLVGSANVIGEGGIGVDADGNAYLAGRAFLSSDVPTTPGAIRTSIGGAPSYAGYGYIAKFNSTGTKMLYGAMIGGSTPIASGRNGSTPALDTRFQAIAVDIDGNAFLTGTTISANFPTTPGAVQGSYAPTPLSNGGAFALKLNPTGSTLVYSTLLGNGSGGRGIAIDAEGQAVVTGDVDGDMPLKAALQASRRNATDAFVTKLNATGTGLIFSTYLGSDGLDLARAVAVDQQGNAYVTGGTSNGQDNINNQDVWGLRFPTTPGAYRTSEGKYSGNFISKFGPSGNLVYSTLIFGGIGGTQPYYLAVDNAGCAYFGAYTTGSSYPSTPGAYQTKNSAACNDCDTDMVLTKLSADGSKLVYSTYYGTDKGVDKIAGLAVDGDGNAYFACQKNYTLKYTNRNGTFYEFQLDTEVVKLNAQGNAVKYSVTVPGAFAWGLALDADRNVYIGGTAFPLKDGFTATAGAHWTYGEGGGFVAKITEEAPPPPALTYNISGTVYLSKYPNATPIPGAKVTLMGSETRTATTDSKGNYTFNDVPAGGDYLVVSDYRNYESWPKIKPIKNLSANQVVNISVLQTQRARLVTNVSAASYEMGPLAADSIVSAFGSNLTTNTETATRFPLPNNLGSTWVGITDSRGKEIPALLFFVSPTQVNYALPSGLASGPAIVNIVSSDQTTSRELIYIEPTSPGLFSADASGRGYAAANVQRRKANGEQVIEDIARYDITTGKMVAVPIDMSAPKDEVYLSLYGTGVRNNQDAAKVSATIGGIPVTVTYIGAQYSYVGLDQINLMVPRQLAGRGDVDVVISVEGKVANTVRVKIK